MWNAIALKWVWRHKRSMDPIRFRFPILRTLASALVLLFVFAGGTPVLKAERQPNIILMMADDASWEAFGCYGAEDYRTPHLDSLAARGIRFEHCYSTPICTPSRVKLMTGQYNFRNYTHFGYLSPKEKTFGHRLQEAGYQTAIAGKWQLNGLYNSLPGNQDSLRPLKAGFNESLLWQVTKGKGNADGGGERFWNPPLEHNGKFITKEENWGKYGPDLLVDFICDFMERNQERPFFVYYPMVLVHDPFVRTPDTLGDQPLAEANKAPKDPAARKQNFVDMVHYMDKLVGRIEAKVESLGLAEETILLFTADNGTNRSIRSQWNGREIRGGKGGMKDMGTHVPFIAYWKNHTPRGAVYSDLIDFTDFYPTLMEAAGASADWTDPVDGRSFFPRLKGLSGEPRQWVFWHYQSYWGQIPGQAARTAQFKLYRDGRLFWIANDLDETNDLSQSSDVLTTEAQKLLAQVLEQAPPAHTEKATRTTLVRPTYPMWSELEAHD